MPESTFVIYECQRPECRLRYPDYVGGRFARKCPACHAPVSPETEQFQNDSITDADITKVKFPIEVFLDNLRSVLNVGSIFRTADGSGVKKIHLCGITPTPDNPRLTKTGLGSEANVPWIYYRNGLVAFKKLKSSGYRCWAIERAKKSLSIDQEVFASDKMPLLLVIGNELSGVDPAILAECDKVVSIPMYGHKRSLNVSVAFAVAVYTIQFKSSQLISPGIIG